jgi:two-component system, chemotaxis family, chemotaxis protein CheY
MAIIGERTAAAGYADDAGWRPRGQRPSRNASVRVVNDDLVTRNGRLSGNGKPRRVLIVDDDRAIRMLCSINLQIEGHRVLEAADGERGLERARSERPDLVVKDVMMPGLDGFQLAEALRPDERTREIPLIFLGSEAGPAKAEGANELGALAYLTKPSTRPPSPRLSQARSSALTRASNHRRPTASAVAEFHRAASTDPQSIDEQKMYTATKEKRCKSNRTHRHRCRQRNLSSPASSDYGDTATAPGSTPGRLASWL